MRLSIILVALSIIACNKTAGNLLTTDESYSTFKQSVANERTTQRDSRSEDNAVLNLNELSYFDLNVSYRVAAKFEAANSKGSLEIPTSSGSKKEFYKYGTLFFELKGEKQRLNVYRNIASMRNPKYKNYLFLPFTDDSNGEETYGGGRYIDLKIEDIVDNEMILDFNVAYSPYCAYGDGWNCPIPPVENHIPLKLLVGEMAFTGLKSNRN